MSALVILAGSLLVLLNTWHRFSEPSANRSSTTAIRYYLAAAFYCLWGLFFYATLIIVVDASPESARKALTDLLESTDLSSVSSVLPLPILVALLMTVLLPKVPSIASADGWVREQIEHMASIPYEVRRLAAELERSEAPGSSVTFTIPPAVQERVRQRLQTQEFASVHIRFEGGSDMAVMWTKASALVLAVADWRADPKLAIACETCATSIDEIVQLHEDLGPRVRRCLRALSGGHAEPGDPEASGIFSEYTGEVERQVKTLLGTIYRTVAAATLRCELTHQGRMARLAKLGFHFEEGLSTAPMTVGHRLGALYAGLVTGILVLKIAMKYVKPAWWTGYPHTMALSVLVPLIYVIAVLWAIFLKRSWGGTTRPRGEPRPFLAYLLSGLLAAASNLPIALGLAFLYHPPVDNGDVTDALKKSLVWMLLSLTSAATTAFLIDDQPRSLARRFAGRWSEGAVQGIVTAMIAFLVGRVLFETGLDTHLTLPQLVPVAGAIGFALGVFVPTWYRTPAPRQARRAAESARRRRRVRRPHRLVVAERPALPSRAAA